MRLTDRQQMRLADLGGIAVRTINEHISKVFVDGELIAQATILNFRIVQAEGLFGHWRAHVAGIRLAGGQVVRSGAVDV